MAYTISAAQQSGIFEAVVVFTDSERYASIARHYGAEVPFLRPPEIVGSLSPDIEWVEYTLARLRHQGRTYDCFSILRPPSPVRQPETIRRAWAEFLAEKGCGLVEGSGRVRAASRQDVGDSWDEDDAALHVEPT